jgi:hypothetical protein
LESDGCFAPRSPNSSFEDEILEMIVTHRNGIACPRFGVILQPTETSPMRSKFAKLAISAVVVTSLFGSTLIASAQNQTAPSASNDGSVSPGATSGKKTQHEKGMTTGSSTRSGANKGGAASPPDQDNAGSPADNVAAPKSGSRY